MDSLSLSGCGNAAVFVHQDEPGTVKRWGRYVVSLSGIDDLQQLAQKELSTSIAMLAEPDLQPTQSRQLVSGVNVSGNGNAQQFADVLKPFGFCHPFFSIIEMRAYASEFLRNFSEAAKATTSNSRKCNILFSLFLAHQFSCDILSDRELMQEVVNIDAAFFSQYVRCVDLYRQMSEQLISTLQAEQVQELYELVQATEFFPAAWFLVKLALNSDNRYLFSPFFLPSLLSPFLHRSGEVAILVTVFSAQREDALIYFNDLTGLKELRSISPADVFMAHIASTVTGEPVTNNQWLREQSNVSESIQMNVFTKWSDIVASRRAGGRGYIRDLNIHCRYEQVNKMMTESGSKFVGKRQFNSMRGGVFKQHDKDAILRTFFVQILQNPAVQDSPFLVALIRLTQSLMYQCSAGVSRRPMISLMYLVNAADTGVFPLLRKNAGDIYFGFGLFEKARVQYQLLLYSHCGLPESLKKRLESLIEMCELNIPAPLEVTDPAPKTPKKTGKVRHRQRKKTTSAAKPVECTNSTAAKPQSHPPYQESGKSLLADPPQVDSKVAEQPDSKPHPGLAEADPVPAGFTTVSYSRVKKTGEFRPEPGPFSDQNPEVRAFNREVNCLRDLADLMGEKECIERWLGVKLVYGRICEDAAWFYLRQCILPIQMKRAVLDCDLQTMEKDQVIGEERMLGFALGWIARAMACYLESSLDRGVRSSRLREILVSFHEHYPEKKRDAEACKRLRSGCSGFGHVFSQWSAVVSNSKMKGLHMQRGHEFFALKRIADPLYYAQVLETGLSGDRKVVTTSDATG